jgi:hypothetical protein
MSLLFEASISSTKNMEMVGVCRVVTMLRKELLTPSSWWQMEVIAVGSFIN